MIERLNQVNDVSILPVTDPGLRALRTDSHGLGLQRHDSLDGICAAIPETGNIYLASVPELEALEPAKELETVFYGGMPCQIGYCNGRNTTYNGFEYHKGSEINVAVTDFMLVLGHTWQMKGGTFRVEDAQVFFVEKGTALEMYQTTLHLSPCRVSDEGFKDIVVLPRGPTRLFRKSTPQATRKAVCFSSGTSG